MEAKSEISYAKPFISNAHCPSLDITAMIDDTGANVPRVLGLTAPDPSSSPQAGGPAQIITGSFTATGKTIKQ